jgi:uncharacterized membrane protein
MCCLVVGAGLERSSRSRDSMSMRSKERVMHNVSTLFGAVLVAIAVPASAASLSVGFVQPDVDQPLLER